MRIEATQRDGYVLVLTLAVIALAAISLAGLARYSLSLVASAQDEVAELQERWGLYSVRHLLEERVAAILDAQTSQQQLHTPPWPKTSRVSVAFPLGMLDFRVQIADEDAKASLNVIARRKPQELLPAIRRLTSDEGGQGLPTQLMPSADHVPAFASWGQVFDLTQVDTRRISQQLAAASRELTCWGGERLNLRRASDAVLLEVAGLVLPDNKAHELVTLRQDWGGGSIDELLALLELRRAQQLAIRRLVTNESRCYSLWIEIEIGERSWTNLVVRDGQTVSFSW